MTTKLAVRMANRWDLGRLEVLLDKAIEESKGVLPEYDAVHCYHTAINRTSSGLVYLAVELDEVAKNEKTIGCLMMEIRAFDWAPDVKLLESVHLYVLPEYRSKTMPDGKTFAYEALIGFGQSLADTAGLPFVVENFFQVGPENRAAVKDEAFKRAGFAYLGGKHIYMPKEPAKAEAAPAAA